MWIAETIDLDDHDSVVRFMKNQSDKIKKLERENKDLKQELKIYRNIAKCSNCEYHSYDWYDDGDEFEVCEKGNDMWYRICKDWKELE